MALSPGGKGYGSGPAGKSHSNTVGPRPAPNLMKRSITRSTKNTMFYRGTIGRGGLGKRGR
jgi:hypothetical protein